MPLCQFTEGLNAAKRNRGVSVCTGLTFIYSLVYDQINIICQLSVPIFCYDSD